MNKEELEIRFTYHPPNKDQIPSYNKIRDFAKQMAFLLLEECPNSTELHLAITKLEESVMWANASIARRSEKKD